jgi:hypothetical protein
MASIDSGDDARWRWPNRYKIWLALFGQHHEVDDLPDCGDGMPRDVLAYRRIRDHLRDWRDRHDADDDPLFDKNLESFHVGDVTLLWVENVRLRRFQDEVCSAFGPPLKGYVWRNGKYVPE